MQGIGTKLKHRRDELKLSISEVAISTKINGKTLQAMELGDLERLPAKIFLRGFVRTYATYLKMDVKSVLDQFQEEMGPTRPHPGDLTPPQFDVFSGFSLKKLLPSRKKLFLVTFLILALVSIFVLKTVYDKYERETLKNTNHESLAELVPPPSTTATTVEALPNDEPSPSASKEKGPSAGLKKLKNSALSTEKSKVLLNTPAKITPPKATTKNESKKVIAQEPEKKPIANTQKKAPPHSGPHQIIIESLDEVSLDYRADGNKLKSKTLSPDEVFIINAKNSVAIDIDDGGAVNIIHNGKDKGVPGDLGQSVKVRFP